MTIYREAVRPDFWQLFRKADGNYLDPMGPQDCTTHSMDRAIMRHFEGKRPAGSTGLWLPTGYSTRRYTNDFVGGTNLGQMRYVGLERYAMNLIVAYRASWSAFEEMLAEGRGAILQLWYRRIRDSKYRGSESFFSNHAVFCGGIDRARGVITGVIDPLADGRRNLFQGPADYPISLLKAAAGELNVAASGYRAVGAGLVYAGFTQPTGAAPVPPAAPKPVERIPMNVLDGLTSNAILTSNVRRMQLPAGTVLYRQPAGAALVKTAKPLNLAMTGYPGTGWRTIVVSLKVDGVMQTVEAYVKKNAGQIS